MLVLPSPERIEQAVAILRRGGLVAFPTETVYGLGADARIESAVAKIFEVKGRAPTNPLIVHLARFNDIFEYADLDQCFDRAVVTKRLDALSTLWPGPLSIVLPRSPRIPKAVCAGGDTVAIRIPNHPVALALLKSFGGPIAAPSANPSNYISPTTAQHVATSLGNRIDLILDGGPCRIGLESTVLSLIAPTPIVLRPGAVTRETLGNILGVEVRVNGALSSEGSSPLPSPGMMSKHYSPRTKVLLWDPDSTPPVCDGRVGAIRFSAKLPPFETAACVHLSDSGDLEQVAARLFAALRELDARSLDYIVVDTCERSGLGEAIMDRLLRASA